MNEVAQALLGTRKTVAEIAEDFGIDPSSIDTTRLECCTSCNLWQKSEQVKIDLDGNPICRYCFAYYGP
jgi:hypothetical protein